MWKPRLKGKFWKRRVAVFDKLKSALATYILVGNVHLDYLLGFDSYSWRIS